MLLLLCLSLCCVLAVNTAGIQFAPPFHDDCHAYPETSQYTLCALRSVRANPVVPIGDVWTSRFRCVTRKTSSGDDYCVQSGVGADANAWTCEMGCVNYAPVLPAIDAITFGNSFSSYTVSQWTPLGSADHNHQYGACFLRNYDARSKVPHNDLCEVMPGRSGKWFVKATGDVFCGWQCVRRRPSSQDIVRPQLRHHLATIWVAEPDSWLTIPKYDNDNWHVCMLARFALKDETGQCRAQFKDGTWKAWRNKRRRLPQNKL